jgi:hypothetical protein
MAYTSYDLHVDGVARLKDPSGVSAPRVSA